MEKKKLIRNFLTFYMMVCIAFAMFPMNTWAEPSETSVFNGIDLDVKEIGDTGYTASDFQYQINSDSPVDFLCDPEMETLSCAEIPLLTGYTISIINTKDEDFYGFAYSFDDTNWYSTSDEPMRQGDTYDSDSKTLTISIADIEASGESNLIVHAYIHEPIDENNPDENNPDENNPDENQEKYTNLKTFIENKGWGVKNNSNVDTMKTALVAHVWDVISHECNIGGIYDGETFSNMVMVTPTQAGTETISDQSVGYYDFTVTIPVPNSEPITASSKFYAVPDNHIILVNTNQNTKMLWNYSTANDLVFDDTEPEHFECIGAIIKGRDKKTNICFLEIEGGLLSPYMYNVRIVTSGYQGIKFDVEEGAKTAAQWGYFNHPYVDLGSTSTSNPERVSMFYGYQTLILNKVNASDQITIDNVKVQTGKGVPDNAITYDSVNNKITFNTDYYTEVPLMINYNTNQNAYVTINRTGIHVNGWMRSGDHGDNSDEYVLHGSGENGTEFNWGTDNYVIYATYYADNNIGSGYKGNAYAKLTYGNGRTETKTISGTKVNGGEKVDSFDFQIYKGSPANAPTRVEVIAYIEDSSNTSCSSAFTTTWNR